MAYFHCLIGGGSSGGGYELTVTCDADFAGTTITATDGVTTLTQTCPSASPYNVVFAIPNGGEWTISGMVGAATYSESIDIPDSLELHSTPEGSTVLPTDDIQTWLACAGITDKSYTTLNEVLSDSTTLLALMSDDNAVDYLVRSTTWASGITADSTAMTDIGANNYCANTLLSDSTWAEAICNSTYFESVLNTKVPVMTSDTTPSGEVSASSIYDSYNYAWYAFSDNNYNWTASTASPWWIKYEFTNAIILHKLYLKNSPYSPFKTFIVQGSNDDTNWTDIQSITSTDTNINAESTYIITNNNSYVYYRLYITEYVTVNLNAPSCRRIQFYGRSASS